MLKVLTVATLLAISGAAAIADPYPSVSAGPADSRNLEPHDLRGARWRGLPLVVAMRVMAAASMTAVWRVPRREGRGRWGLSGPRRWARHPHDGCNRLHRRKLLALRNDSLGLHQSRDAVTGGRHIEPPNEVYAVTAYVLYLNGIVRESRCSMRNAAYACACRIAMVSSTTRGRTCRPSFPQVKSRSRSTTMNTHLQRALPVHGKLGPQHPCRGSHEPMGPRQVSRLQCRQSSPGRGPSHRAGTAEADAVADRWLAQQELGRIRRAQGRASRFRIHRVRQRSRRSVSRTGRASR